MLFNKLEEQWTQRYRPLRLEDVVIPKAIKDRLIRLRDEKESLNLVLHGPFGTGKTTIACLLNPESTQFVRCASESGIKQIRDIAKWCSTVPFTSEPRVVVFDEAENISKQAFGVLRTEMERFSKSNMFVFTANHINKIDDAILSRVTEFNFAEFQGDLELKDKFVERGITILENEGIKNYKVDTIRAIAKNTLPDARKFVSELQMNFG